MAKTAFKKPQTQADVFRFIDGTLIGKSGRRSQAERDMFVSILNEYAKYNKQTLAVLKDKFDIVSSIHGEVSDSERERYNALHYTFYKMQDCGLVFRVAHGEFQFSTDLWAAYLRHKETELSYYKGIFENQN